MEDATREITVPRHVAIIMDGNGRWAQQRGNSRSFGHEHGKRPVRESIEACLDLGVECLSLYAFSTENWKRPPEEVSTLMRLLGDSLREHEAELLKQGVRVRTLGDIRRLPSSLQSSLERLCTRSAGGERMTVCLALNYGGRQEIARAARHLAREVQAGNLRPEDIDEDLLAHHLYTDGLPEVELLIRTSGEERISNFMLWQCAYAEFVFSPVLWPDFRRDDLLEAVAEFSARERRFGGLR